MAKKLFGGKSSGRFSGTRGGSTPRPDPIEEDALTYLDEPAPEEPADDLTPPELIIPEEEPVQIPEEPALEDELPQLEEAEDDYEDDYEYESPEEIPESPRQARKARKKQKKAKKKSSPLKVVSILLALILFIELAYCLVIFTDLIPPIAKLRSI